MFPKYCDCYSKGERQVPTANYFLFIAAVNGFLAVVLGAFGSHGLKSRLTEHYLGVWQTAVQYHFYHALALCMVALLWHKAAGSHWLNAAGYLLIVGIVFFCGSLYWLALGGPRWLGPVTPLGGLCFLLGWLCIAVSAFYLTQ
jgi:uncharacterized membrane protein YgdD (TMEM256/DUF423 family)